MSDRRFPELPSGYPFPFLEREVLAHWRQHRVFENSLRKHRDGPRYVFYEGPPTANNAPHVGHVPARIVKDLFPRFRTMRGYRVARKAGWDTHGLPVEIEVEKRLGFSGKGEIETYGIEKFNHACLESVHAYEKQWRAMTERIGYWIDLDGAYHTYANRYVESVWWALSRLWQRGLLEKGYKIQPYCVRCGTTLSSHEVAQNYQETDDPSIWVLFPARPGQALTTVAGESWETPPALKLVAWTTTPWTLTAHVGLTVHPRLTYRVTENPARPGETLLFAEELETAVPCEVEREGESVRFDLRQLPALARLRGDELEGLRYDRPYASAPADRTPAEQRFEPTPSDRDGWCVLTGDYVTASEGTGLVHTAPPFGEDDYQSGLRYGLPFILTVDGEGMIRPKKGIERFAGMRFKRADPEIIEDLERRGLLLHSDRYRHSYPFCWRCDQPLLYYATVSWFVKTTDPSRKQRLIEANQTDISWHPAHVGEGRFGNWLENVVDWALSRKRYWGTPLPVWECDRCEHTEVVGSFAELFAAAGRELPADPYDPEQFNPHRPYVDRQAPGEPFVWSCPACGEGVLGRVDDVIDAWFDSGAMPFAQHHYLGLPQEAFDPESGVGFPADFIAEGVDQTRGWFYTLHVLGVLLFDSVAYRNCIVLGHVNDEQGRKMSKRLGNVVDPMEVVEETGADALRWYFYASNPEITSRFSERLVREASQRFLLPLWNALSFFTIYANLDGWRPGSAVPGFAMRPPLDRWILLRLDRLTAETGDHLESYRVTDAARGLELFVDDLTNWYIRRSRDRFWAPKAVHEADKESAYHALYEVLTRLARLIAPFTPFVAEVLHGHLIRSQDPAASSVHLDDWPEPTGGRSDDELETGMAVVQRAARLGHAARNEHGIKTRQPLASVTLVTADREVRQRATPHLDLLREELNVREVRWAEDRSAWVRHEIRPVYPRCGPRFGKRMPQLKRALETADGEALAAELDKTGRLTVALDAERVELSAAEVEVRLIEREDTAIQGDRELLVVLDTELDQDLITEGRAREVVHRVQSARKAADLDYADRIRVRYRAAPELETAIDAHREWIAEQTLAAELTADSGGELRELPIDNLDFALAIERTD